MSFFPPRKVSFAEISLIPETICFLLISRLNVSFRSSKKYLPLNKVFPFSANKENNDKASLIANVVNGLAKRTPWDSTCLVKTLTAHRMLKRRNIGHKLHFGVLKTNDQLQAHSWLSIDGKILIGGENSDDFQEIIGQ